MASHSNPNSRWRAFVNVALRTSFQVQSFQIKLQRALMVPAEKLYQLEHPRLVAEFNEICATETENEGYWISKAWLKGKRGCFISVVVCEHFCDMRYKYSGLSDWQLNKPKMHVPSQPDPSPENASDDPALNFRSHVYCKHDNLSINTGSRRRISREVGITQRPDFI